MERRQEMEWREADSVQRRVSSEGGVIYSSKKKIQKSGIGYQHSAVRERLITGSK